MPTRTKTKTSPKASSNNAIEMLKADHRKVKKLFDDFEKEDSSDTKGEIAKTAIIELKIHAKLEEEIFYPAVREALAAKGEDLMNEAEEEHHVVEMIISELERMDASDEKFNAKFTVMAENVRHHIKEEEGDMLPKAQRSKVDLQELGAAMATRKAELQQELEGENASQN